MVLRSNAGIYFDGELRGQAKKKESVFDIFRVLSALKLPFGQVAVNFGEPLALADFLDPEDRRRTIEGYPAPRRAVLIATKPA